MILFTFENLRSMVDLTKIDSDFLAQGFKLAAVDSGRNHLWTTMDDLEKDAEKHAIDNGWDPATMLVLYDPPRTEEERAAAAEEIKRQIEEDPDWDDIQIGEVDPKRVIASVYKNMTPEKLVKELLRPWEMRVFS